MTLNQIGLILNLVGTILVVSAITEFNGGWTKNEKTQENEYLALFKYPTIMKLGVLLFIVGFAFSFASTF